MNQRKQLLIKKIVEEYIRSAEPVASSLLVDNFNLSSATLRNEMAELEEEGFVLQPHISAGRVPSEIGYIFFVDKFLKKDQKPSSKEIKILETSFNIKNDNLRRQIKNLAKQLSDISSETVLIGFETRDVFYTGISNLFSKPEFADPQKIYNLSFVIDHLDNVMAEIYEEINDGADEIKILIGKNNPFANDCSVLLTQFINPGQKGIIGLLGPMRMNYQKNYNLLNYSKKLLSQIK